MSNIKFFALGGLGEVGKNIYICDCDNQIFILDAGLKFPNSELLGVDNVYPNINYLIENEDRIAGLFLTHAHDENIGAAIEIIKKFNIKVFGSFFTLSVLESRIEDEGLNVSDYKLYKINETKTLKFDSATVEFYFVCHNIPETANIAIVTNDGAFVYAPDFTFDIINDKRYRINFDKITSIGRSGVLALACGSMGVNNVNGTHNNNALEYNVSQLAMKDKRIIISMYSTDLIKLQRVINICMSYNRRVAIFGRKTQRLISSALTHKYFYVDEAKLINLRFMDDINQNKDKDLAIIVTGERHEPYFSIQRMCRGLDKLIKIDSDDEVLFIAPVDANCERIASRAMDEILMAGAKYYYMREEELRSGYADGEELKILYDMLKPKYLIPIVGEYRHQFVHRKIALQYGFKDRDIVMLENGDVLEIENGNIKSIEKGKIECGDVLVDGSFVGTNVNDVVLRDRELLSEEGIIVVSILINKTKKEIIDGPIVKSSGYIFEDGEPTIDDLKNEAIKFMDLYFKMVIDNTGPSCNELLRDYLLRYMFPKIQKRPIIVPGVIAII